MLPPAQQAPTRATETKSGSSVIPQKATESPDSAKVVAPKNPEPLVDMRQMRRELEDAIKRLNEQVQQNARELGFSIDEETDRLIVRVTNKETGELIRQIPAEAVIRFSRSIEDLRGVLFDEEL
jgi:flagellar protein FlaG